MYMYLLKAPPYLSNQLAICSQLQRSPLLAISRGKSGARERFLHPRIHALLLPSAHRTRTVSNYSPETTSSSDCRAVPGRRGFINYMYHFRDRGSMIPTGRYLYSQPPLNFESCPSIFFFFLFLLLLLLGIIRSTIYLGRAGDTVSLNGCALLAWCAMITYLPWCMVVYEETTCKRHPTTVLTHASHDLSRTGQVISSKWQSLLLSTRQCWQWKGQPRATG